MELFEILFIAIFILFPIMEQVLKRRRGAEEEEPGPVAMESPPGEIDAPSSEREPVQASEMVPDDLWAVLTGEQRPGRPDADGVGVEEEVRGEGDAGDDGDVDWPTFEGFDDDARRESAADPQEAWSGADSDWTRAPDPEEAYSLERLDYEPVERTVPSAEARHRAFHDRIDRPQPVRRRRRSTVGRALGNPDTLRHAMILNEVLGPPKGLD